MEDELKFLGWKISLSRRVSLSIKIIILFIIFLSFLSLCNAFLSYSQAISILNQGLGEELLAIVKNSSYTFPSEELKLLVSLIGGERREIRKISLQKISERLKKIKEINFLDSVYVMIKKGNFGYVIASCGDVLEGEHIPLNKFSLSAFRGIPSYDRKVLSKGFFQILFQQFSLTQERKSAYAPVYFQDKIVGVLGIEASWERSFNQILKIRNQAVTFFVVSIILSLILSIIVAQSITGPVKLLLTGIQRVAKGDLSYQIKVKNLWILPWRDEIGELTVAFNRMTKNLQEKNEENKILYEEINRFNRELERKIKDATHSLEEINKRLIEKETQRDEELKLATQIQKTLLPHNFYKKGVRIVTKFTPAAELGGDFYNFSLIDPENLGVVIGDVAGKGVPAALLMAMAVGILHETSRGTTSPAEILKKANNTIRSHIEIDFPNFVSAFYGVLNLNTKFFTYSKAGHEIPILYRKKENICEFLDAEGLFLGAFADVEYQEKQVRLEEGDRIIFFTDGLIEAKNENGEMFGLLRLKEEILKNRDEKIENMIEKIQNSILSFVKDKSLSDDFAIMIMEIEGEGGEK